MRRNTPVRTAAAAFLHGSRKGFTLVELLMVIGIVAVLASLLLATLTNAKSKGSTMMCLNNQRQLILAWLLYADDHDSALTYNLGDADTRRTVADGTFLNWVNNVMSWEVEPDNTNTMLMSRGGLGPYCSGAVGIYRCPADYALSDLQREAGWTARVRSVSMNAMMGDAGEFTRHGTNANNPYLRQFFRTSQIHAPSQIFVFIEEHPDSITDGYFLNKSAEPEWIDLPASYHGGRANLAFADGHVETHPWLVGSTKPPPRPDATELPMAITPEERADFDWLMARTSYKRYTKVRE